jgi:hypothetical protein
VRALDLAAGRLEAFKASQFRASNSWANPTQEAVRVLKQYGKNTACAACNAYTIDAVEEMHRSMSSDHNFQTPGMFNIQNVVRMYATDAAPPSNHESGSSEQREYSWSVCATVLACPFVESST